MAAFCWIQAFTLPIPLCTILFLRAHNHLVASLWKPGQCTNLHIPLCLPQLLCFLLCILGAVSFPCWDPLGPCLNAPCKKKKHLKSAAGIQQLPIKLCKAISNRFPKEAASHWMPSQHVWLDFLYEWSNRKADHPWKSEHLLSGMWEAGNTTEKR